MANEEHLAILKQGVEVWNKWRNDYPDISPDLSEAHLEGADLSDVHLEKADLEKAHLERANLGKAHLEGANLGGAHLDRANLSKAHLEGANLWGAHLERAHLGGAHLEGAYLWEAYLVRAISSGAHLESANLSKAHLESAILRKAHLDGADLWDAHLEEAYLDGAHLESANLSKAHLEGAYLWEANLEGADLRNANLEGADLRNANLERANLGEAHLKGTVLIETNFENANLRGVSSLILDYSRTRNASFSPRAPDPWSVLRRTYTGPKFLFILIFLIAFFIPYVGKTMYWSGVNRAQSVIIKFTEELEAKSNLETNAFNKRILAELSKIQPCLKPDCTETRIGWVVLGFDKDISYWSLGLLLIIYNIMRAILTWFVGPLRDEEERSGYSPAYNPEKKFNLKASLKALFIGELGQCPSLGDILPLQYLDTYGWLVPIHKIAHVLIYISIIAFLWHAFDWFSAPIWLP